MHLEPLLSAWPREDWSFLVRVSSRSAMMLAMLLGVYVVSASDLSEVVSCGHVELSASELRACNSRTGTCRAMGVLPSESVFYEAVSSNQSQISAPSQTVKQDPSQPKARLIHFLIDDQDWVTFGFQGYERVALFELRPSSRPRCLKHDFRRSDHRLQTGWYVLKAIRTTADSDRQPTRVFVRLQRQQGPSSVSVDPVQETHRAIPKWGRFMWGLAIGPIIALLVLILWSQ